jgi:hypothetical protein
MESWVKNCLENLEYWDHNVFSFLVEQSSVEQISLSIENYRMDPPGFHERAEKLYGLSQSSCNAIIGLSYVRDLIEESKRISTKRVPVESAAQFSWNAFQAGLFIGMASPGRSVEFLESKQQYAEKTAIKKSSMKANDARYLELRKFKERVACVARVMWLEGSDFLHNQMATYLMEEYQDEDGKHPFTNLPNNKKSSPDKVILKVLKQVAVEIGRPDLIHGRKKTP